MITYFRKVSAAVIAVMMIFLCSGTAQAVDRKLSKQAAKEAKKLEKEGWKTMNLPIQEQLEETWEMMASKDDEGYRKYISKEVVAIAGSYSAAQSQAENIAKIRIASDIGSSVASLTNVALKNEELSARDASTLNSIAENAKVLVSRELGRVITAQTIYRIVDARNYEVRVVVLYDMRKAMRITHDVMMQQIQDQVEENVLKLMSGMLGEDNLIGAYTEGGFDETI